MDSILHGCDSVLQRQIGRLQCSRQHELHIETIVAFHLVFLSRGFATWIFQVVYGECQRDPIRH